MRNNPRQELEDAMVQQRLAQTGVPQQMPVAPDVQMAPQMPPQTLHQPPQGAPPQDPLQQALAAMVQASPDEQKQIAYQLGTFGVPLTPETGLLVLVETLGEEVARQLVAENQAGLQAAGHVPSHVGQAGPLAQTAAPPGGAVPPGQGPPPAPNAGPVAAVTPGAGVTPGRAG